MYYVMYVQIFEKSSLYKMPHQRYGVHTYILK
jgi:hypothetical protein